MNADPGAILAQDLLGPNNGRQESAEGGESEQEEIEDLDNLENVL